MVDGMMKCGMRCSEAEAYKKTKRTAYNKVVFEFKRNNKPLFLSSFNTKGITPNHDYSHTDSSGF
jgi:hypothetical protein